MNALILIYFQSWFVERLLIVCFCETYPSRGISFFIVCLVEKKMKILKNRQGLTIIEILVSIMILLPIFSGAMITFVKCIEFSELSRHSSEAVLATRNKITQILFT